MNIVLDIYLIGAFISFCFYCMSIIGKGKNPSLATFLLVILYCSIWFIAIPVAFSKYWKQELLRAKLERIKN